MAQPDPVKIEELVSDRNAFNDFIYTPLDEALKELSERRLDTNICGKVASLVTAGIPDVLLGGQNAVLFRQLATPNYEFRRFLSITDAIGQLKPVFWEYFEDKFTPNNEWKRSLGKLSFFFGTGKKGGSKIERENVIDFNKFNGHKISEVATLWGQSLVDFHHECIEKTSPKVEGTEYFDASKWFALSGGHAKDYYVHFLALMVKDAILFENFLIDEKEVSFTKEVFLPAFMKVQEITGHKPLIVALEPTDIEGDEFWMCHPHESMAYVKEKLKLV